MTERSDFPILRGRWARDIAFCNAPVALAIFLVLRVSWWLYPLAVLVIANRIFALSLVGHEALHGNLMRNRRWNDAIGRWLCLYPCIMSLTRYRQLHLLHHGAVGSERHDPDLSLYQRYPLPLGKFLGGSLTQLATGRMTWGALRYYAIPDPARWKSWRSLIAACDDLPGLLLFWIVYLAAIVKLHLLGYFLLFQVVPGFLFVQPYVLLVAALQHGPRRRASHPALASRSMRGPKWLMEVLLPCDINFHAEHHSRPAVPHYHLRRLAAEMEASGQPAWRETYWECLRSLFSPSPIAMPELLPDGLETPRSISAD